MGTPIQELDFIVTFDPVREWNQIETKIGVNHTQAGMGFDEWIKRKNELINKLATAFEPLGLSYSEIFDRVNAVPRARWALGKVQKLNEKIYPGFVVEEMIDEASLVEIIASGSLTKDDLIHLRNTGKVDKRWVAIDEVDALGVSTGMLALAAKEGISLGRNAVDLGGGEGSWGVVLAKLGFTTTIIERDQTLAEASKSRVKKLIENNIALAKINTINGEFHLEESENTPEVNETLKNADIMVCYPWPYEVVERLKIFKQYAKEGGILVMYGSGTDDFYLDLQKVSELGLEIVGFNKKELSERTMYGGSNMFKGLPAPGGGSNWIMIRKIESK